MRTSKDRLSASKELRVNTSSLADISRAFTDKSCPARLTLAQAGLAIVCHPGVKLVLPISGIQKVFRGMPAEMYRIQ